MRAFSRVPWIMYMNLYTCPFAALFLAVTASYIWPVGSIDYPQEEKAKQQMHKVQYGPYSIGTCT